MARELHDEGDPFGSHRSVEPRGSLPQPAWRLDNDFSRLFRGEMLVGVETLNIDAASFRQMQEAGDARAKVLETVGARGKQHNPVTGSGGMLLGRVLELAPGRPREDVKVGDRVASLVSLSLTPLILRGVSRVREESAQMDVEGEAVLFASSPYAIMPTDIAERVALAALDVAGAAPQVARLAREGAVVVVLGAGGKSGTIACTEAKRRGAIVVGVEPYTPYARDLAALEVCDSVLEVDARDPLAVRAAVTERAGEADVVISCVNVPDVEMSAILCAKDGGKVYFFAMTTSFTKAALGAEGVGRDVELVIGNGFARGHAAHTLDLLRSDAKLRALFERRYGG